MFQFRYYSEHHRSSFGTMGHEGICWKKSEETTIYGQRNIPFIQPIYLRFKPRYTCIMMFKRKIRDHTMCIFYTKFLAPPAIIQPGSYIYNFSCQLPYEVPSSFESPYGHIRYSVKVVLDRPKRFDNTFTKNFTVLKALDLNYEPPAIRVKLKTTF